MGRAIRGIGAILLVAALCATPASAAVSSVVTEWLLAAQNTVLSVSVEHQQAARLYGLVGSAQYDAIKLIRDYKKYDGIPLEAAAAYASHSVLSHLFYWRQTAIYDALLSRQLASITGWSDSYLPVLRQAVVPRVHRLLIARLTDGASIFANFKPATASPANIGKYQFAPNQTSSRYPQVANASGYYLSNKDVDDFTAPLKRFDLSDPEYARELEQVYWFGSANSTNRTQYQNDSPRFWALGSGTGTIAGVWINISINAIPAGTPLIHQARFFKLLGTSFWDAAVACWRVKHRELFWRPITAIRTQHGQPWYDPAWAPLLATPQHPEYPSGHQCSSGAAVYVLEAHLGANTPVDVVSQGAPDVGVRTFPNFYAAGIDSGDSRLFAGVHFNKSNIDALRLGYNIAKHIHEKYYGRTNFQSKL